MANQEQKTRTTQQTHSDDEIDLFELLHFLIKGARYWLSGGLIFGLIALIYALALYPSTYQEQTINDIELDQESLSLVRQVMSAMTVPLGDKMQAEGLEDLYEKITIKGPDFLDETIFGVSGVDLKDKSLDSLSKGKIETVVIRIKGDDYDLAKREIDFIRNNIRGISQYLEVKKFITEEISEAKINLFNLEADLNEQLLNIERTESQLLSYQSIQKESNQMKDMQIILNLTNEEDKISNDDKNENLNNVTEFSGAKYLPIGNRIVAIKSELSDQMAALRIAQFQIDALKLSQNLLNDLAGTFKATSYQGDVINFSPMMQLVRDYRQQKTGYTREEIAAMDILERQLIEFDGIEFRFSNNLPMIVEKKGRLFMILIAGFIGAFLGFLLYSTISLVNAYRRRYKN